MAWVPAVAQVSFYAGSRGEERPRWLIFGGRWWQVELLGEVTVSTSAPGPEERRFLLRCGAGIFRVVVEQAGTRVDLWEGEPMPEGVGDLLA